MLINLLSHMTQRFYFKRNDLNKRNSEYIIAIVAMTNLQIDKKA